MTAKCGHHITDPAFADDRPPEEREAWKVPVRAWNAAIAGRATSHEACPICGCTCWTEWSGEFKGRMLTRLAEGAYAEWGCQLCGCETFRDDVAEQWDRFTEVVADHVARHQREAAQRAALGALDRALAGEATP